MSASKRKPHNNHAGYRAMRRNPLTGGHVTIYETAEQGIDVGGNRYAVVCDIHATIAGSQSMRDARGFMKFPEFCEACMALAVEPLPESLPKPLIMREREVTGGQS